MLIRRPPVVSMLAVSLALAWLPQSVWAQAQTPVPEGNIEAVSLDDLLNTTVVTASKSDQLLQEAASSVSIVTSQDIALFGANTLAEVLERVSSVYMFGGYASPNGIVSIRGDTTAVANTHVLILFNGRPIRESFRGGWNNAIYNSFPLARVQRLEIIRGPGSVLYGTNAYEGVINIITSLPEDTTANVIGRLGESSGGYNQTGYVSGGATALIGQLRLALGAQFSDSNGWPFTLTDEKGVTNTMRMKERDVGVTLEGAYGDFRLQGLFVDTLQPVIARVPVWTTPMDWEIAGPRVSANLGWQRRLNDTITLAINATYNHCGFYEYRSSAANPLGDDGPSNDFLVEATVFAQILPNLKLTAGAWTNTQTGILREFDFKYDVFNLPLNPNPAVLVQPYNQTWFAAYAQGEYSPLPRLNLTAGVQVNKVTDLPVDFAPRFGVVYGFTPSLSAKVLYGQAFRSAVAFERGVQAPPVLVGNPSLKPERVGTLEGVIAYTATHATVTLTGFYSRQTELIARSTTPAEEVLVNGVLTNTYLNKADLSFYGAELEGRVSITNRLLVLGSTTYQRNFNSAGQNDLTGTPQFMLKTGASYQFPFGVQVGVFNEYFAGFSALPGNPPTVNPPVRPYAYLDANVDLDMEKITSARALRGLALNLYGQNLLDVSVQGAEYVRQRINSVPQRPGRTLFVGVKYRY